MYLNYIRNRKKNVLCISFIGPRGHVDVARPDPALHGPPPIENK